MPLLPTPGAAADREDEAARWQPERETLELATAGHLPFPGGGLAGAVVPTPATLLKFALEDREEGHSKSQAETLLCSHADHEAFC